MKFGVCGGPEMTEVAAQSGYDYFEWSVGGLLKPTEPEEAFAVALTAARAAALPCTVLNCFVPGDLKITGPSADLQLLKTYVTTAFRRAAEAGVEAIVFGSGGARRIPDGVERSTAWAQIVAFCRMLVPVAADHGVTVVVEPLNQGECNVLTSVGECGRLVEEVGHPALRLLVDGYHFLKDDQSYSDIERYGRLLSHVHIATIPRRLAPGAESCDFTPFFEALARAGYNGRVSIEGSIPHPDQELPAALELMRRLTR